VNMNMLSPGLGKVRNQCDLPPFLPQRLDQTGQNKDTSAAAEIATAAAAATTSIIAAVSLMGFTTLAIQILSHLAERRRLIEVMMGEYSPTWLRAGGKGKEGLLVAAAHY
jgi:hypothetical protein